MWMHVKKENINGKNVKAPQTKGEKETCAELQPTPAYTGEKEKKHNNKL